MRRNRPGRTPLEHYLLYDYPRRVDYAPECGHVLARPQLHETARTSSGHFVFVQGGKPAMKKGMLNRLSGYPWQAVRIAIDFVREQDREAIVVLEWYQGLAHRGLSRYELACDLHMDESALSKRLASAVRQVDASLAWARDQWDAGIRNV